MRLGDFGTQIENLSGVGPATAKHFARLNIFTVADLLSTWPKDYDDRTRRISLKQAVSEAREHMNVHTICKVLSHSWFGYGRMKTLKIFITDGTMSASLIAFNRAFLEKSLPAGSIISVTGTFEVKYGELQSTRFEAGRIAYEGELEDFADAVVPGSGLNPVYPLTEGLTQKTFRKAVDAALKLYGKTIDNEIPEDIIRERNLLTKRDALNFIHQPKDLEQVNAARRTLIYEELFHFEYRMGLRTIEHRGSLPTIVQAEVFDTPELTERMTDASKEFSTPKILPQTELEQLTQRFESTLSPRQLKLYKSLSFKLTADQMQAIMDLNADIDRSQGEFNSMLNKNIEGTGNDAADRQSESSGERPPFSMQRLLQGDVGSGKTLVSFFAALRTIDYGGQAALLAPTELLARQHAENAARLLEPTGISTAFLTGNLKAKGRDNLVNALRDGRINLVVGTHALFSRNIQYKKLQLAVIDEQHRFGVAQRESIVDKGRVSFGGLSHSPDLLMMSATPIPQTLALTAFGDLDASVIRTMPQGRKPIKTYLTVMGNEANVYEAVRRELKAGHQAYFVYPRIGETQGEEGDETSAESAGGLKSAEEMFGFLSNQVYPEYSCALVHGKIEEEDQNRILDDFKEGRTKILVATTVVEVGVDVANATCIVIEHADRFGLAELHQLRGRVGRSALQSYCFLTYGKNITETGIARLKALHESTDGFYIAEEDLRLRGPGELSGTSQSGYLSLSIADLARDKDLLRLARYDAFRLIEAKELLNPS